MLILGLQGSPRKKGNTHDLLAMFADEARQSGVRMEIVDVPQTDITPCKGCFYCEKKGGCITKDDAMNASVFPLMRQADIIVTAAPVYFYNVPGQLKNLIDRTQTLWARKYRFHLADPGRPWRKGFLLSVGATRGQNLFEGIHLTMKYFYDAAGADYNIDDCLTYRQIEHRGDMRKHDTVRNDVREALQTLIKPFANRKRVLFACRENACRSQMASAFAQSYAGDRIEAISAGSAPVAVINPLMKTVMEEKGIDMAYRLPQSIDTAIASKTPEMIITMGCDEDCAFIPGAEIDQWNLDDPAGQDISFMRRVRDEIETHVKTLMNRL
jgi:multimeric flavodoxin WrbA